MKEPLSGRLWIRLLKKHRVAQDALIPCARNNPQDALREALPKMDLSQPLWLPRHQADWEEYALTRFRPEDFIEPVWFDSMEISYVYPENEEKQARRRLPLEDA